MSEACRGRDLIIPAGKRYFTCRILLRGDPKHAPSLDHLEKILDDPEGQVAVNLVGVPVEDRSGLFARVLALVEEHRTRTGRPHWVIVDEAHHMLPTTWAATKGHLGGDSGSVVLVTVHPGHVSPNALKNINVLVVLGKEPDKVIAEYCEASGRPRPAVPQVDLETGEALVWFVNSGQPERIKVEPSSKIHERHKRKYAVAELEEERVFYFRGPRNQLRLRSQNLTVFLQIAEGLDDETWLFHLKRSDYSKWLRDAIKDQDVAGAVENIEQDEGLSPAESRCRVAHVIREKYTAPE